MIKLYDDITIKKTGAKGTVIEIDDDDGKRPEIYLVELDDMPDDAPLSEVLIWCEWSEIEPRKKQ